MILPELAAFADIALLLLRLTVAVVFATSGWSHLRYPDERGESLGFSPAATVVLGALEVAGAASVALGIWAQLGALALIGVMLGAIHRKVFVWKTGFWGETAGGGWYYDLLYLVSNLVVLATGGGSLVLV